VFDHNTERGESGWDIGEDIRHVDGWEVDDVEVGGGGGGAEEVGLGGGDGVGGGDDEEADAEAVVGDEAFGELEEGDYVAHAWAWEDGDVGFCGFFVSPRHGF